VSEHIKLVGNKFKARLHASLAIESLHKLVNTLAGGLL